MPKDRDASIVKSIFRQHTHYKATEYERNPEIFPESEVRAFLGIPDTSISCCDGIVERTNIVNILPIPNPKKEYDLLELKGKHLDTLHSDIGQFQMNTTIDHFKPEMRPCQGFSFIKRGGWLFKSGFRFKKGYLYKIGRKIPETLKNDITLRIKYYVDNKLLDKW